MDNRYLRDANATFDDSINLTFEVGYGRYLIDVTSSELSRAIDYRVLEATIGVAVSIEDFNFGINTKALINERYSNLYIENFERPLDDEVSIDRVDYSLYANYNISENASLNLLYKHYKLESNDRYINFHEYDTHFSYASNGLAFSYLHYIDTNYDGSDIILGVGGLYSRANVEIYEIINGIHDDVSIDDRQDAFGIKLLAGYVHKYDNSYLSVMVDWYNYDFDTLDVYSYSLNRTIEEATLTEEIYSIRFGYIYKF